MTRCAREKYSADVIEVQNGGEKCTASNVPTQQKSVSSTMASAEWLLYETKLS
jgi:hypothetical protein